MVCVRRVDYNCDSWLIGCFGGLSFVFDFVYCALVFWLIECGVVIAELFSLTLLICFMFSGSWMGLFCVF